MSVLALQCRGYGGGSSAPCSPGAVAQVSGGVQFQGGEEAGAESRPCLLPREIISDGQSAAETEGGEEIHLLAGLEGRASLKRSLPQKYEVMPQFSDPPLMCMERAATSLFGVKRYGVHVNGFTRQPDRQLAMWVARRSLSKQTYPGLLDNMVPCGCMFVWGIGSQKGIRDTLIKECAEEASIPECIASAARPVGTISYTYEDGEGVFSECQFVFDLEVPSDFSPHVGDGEVHQFYLWPVEKVKDALVTEEFKPNCALVVLDFLIRHSYLHPDTEPNYLELVVGLHRPL
ncbi:thiamin pyrophosphokinase 2 isoform X3 [Polyodon spathula]|uniref:thiamin pyrophosphokinase 2 isoform X3 n=1 Tax=Polyodon spathula TaxID=7913 RepID=UPI001B7EAFE1|nr:thiamin pyrophosphokinase 2 isoform X3 [Polyodon spathula]